MKTSIISAAIVLALVSCEKPNKELNTKISQLEKTAAEAVVRQRQLEMELAAEKILTERDAIERERALIEQERIAMEALRDIENTAATNELQNRESELLERERKVSDNQNELDNREDKITGLETNLNARELDLAGREPLDTLPPLEDSYVSGPTGDFNNFYEPLGAYGSWFQTRDYGYVFQPWAVRDVTWRPYTQGRWAFTNQGWTWVSSEPFGWACYHYGRWALLRNVGWVWVPGTEWAPAWVTWRESADHIGWAPLPPETLAWNDNSWDSSVESRFVIDTRWFSFISYRNFGNNIYSHCLPISQNIVICNNTTNITHYVRRNRCVFVGGPRYRNVCTRIGRDFPIHRLHFEHSPDFGRGGRHLSSKFSGNELNVVAPRMNAEWNRALRPLRVSRDLGDVVVDRTKELPTDIRQQYRDRKNEEDRKAQLVVTNTGGRESFEKERQNRLDKNRQEFAKNELESRGDKNASQRINKAAKILASAVDDLAKAQWEKLIWNIPYNGLAVAEGGVTTDVLLANPSIENKILTLMHEVIVAADAQGIKLDPNLIESNIERTRPMGPYQPSTMIDFIEGRELELGPIWEEPLRRAKAVGVNMPALRRLLKRMKARLIRRL